MRKKINFLNFRSLQVFIAQSAGAVESLQRYKTPTNECPANDIKPSDGEALIMLEF